MASSGTGVAESDLVGLCVARGHICAPWGWGDGSRLSSGVRSAGAALCCGSGSGPFRAGLSAEAGEGLHSGGVERVLECPLERDEGRRVSRGEEEPLVAEE